jgi:[acyl-carrier-protein] S-malonyltransferase
MSALLGAEIEQAEELAKECAAETEKCICVVANDNAPGQAVISAPRPRSTGRAEIAKASGIKRDGAERVGAIHSPKMQPAADRCDALAAVTIRPFAIPVVTNATAAEVSEPEMIRRPFVEQVTARALAGERARVPRPGVGRRWKLAARKF